MADIPDDLGRWSNRRFTQGAAIAFLIVGCVITYAYTLMAGVVVWALALVYLCGSFFIERDLSPTTSDGEDDRVR